MATARISRADENGSTPADPPVVVASGEVSHNLNGQRLGRKGRDTRERILTACSELLAEDGEPISMSAVARRASLGMTSLYNYFSDLTELLLAVLEPVMATSDERFLCMLREYWPDEVLGERCHAFMEAYYGFWALHSRLLHLRNAMADNRDPRMLIHRVESTQPLITLFAAQMGGDSENMQSLVRAMATVLMIGVERTATVSTDPSLTDLFGEDQRRPQQYYLVAEARLMELAIRDTRARLARGELG
ncbi:MAG: TetR/AcrR family transcriptional regulator [Novosphingobium sp.]